MQTRCKPDANPMQTRCKPDANPMQTRCKPDANPMPTNRSATWFAFYHYCVTRLLLANLRRPPFDNPKVREALILAFDFDWTNKHQMHDEYSRCDSYFATHEFASSGLPSGDERKLLEPFRDQLPEKLFTETYVPPTTDGSGNNRTQLSRAVALLKEAGWERKGSHMTEISTGKKLEFKLLSPYPDHERLIMPYIKNLEKIGVSVQLVNLDWSQFVRRTRKFDFDMTQWYFSFEHLPGSELENLFGSASADQEGSLNQSGIKNPVVDHLIAMTDKAESRQAVVNALP